MIKSWCTNSPEQSSFWSPSLDRKGRGAEETSSWHRPYTYSRVMSLTTTCTACAELTSFPATPAPHLPAPPWSPSICCSLSVWTLPFHSYLFLTIQISVLTPPFLRSLPWPPHLRANTQRIESIRENCGSFPSQARSLPLPYFLIAPTNIYIILLIFLDFLWSNFLLSSVKLATWFIAVTPAATAVLGHMIRD